MKYEVKVEKTVMEVHHLLVEAEDLPSAKREALRRIKVSYTSPSYYIDIATEIDAQPRED